MNRRDIVIGVVILLLLAGVIYWRQRSQPSGDDLRVPETLSIEEQLEEKFSFQIPDDVDKTELKDVSGGNSSGIATRKFQEGKFTHSVIVDLPQPSSGSFYQGWLQRGVESASDYSLISTGTIKYEKGGWMIEFQSVKDYSDHNLVLVTEEKLADNKTEKIILEGSF